MEEIRFCLYARKSTESDERQALSIDSQVKEMLQIAERENLNIVEIRREAHSAKDSGQRPVFKEILEDIRKQRFNALLVWHPDRLSRNAGDLGSLVDLIDQKHLVQIRTHSQTFTNNPNEKFLLMILCSQAKLENDNKSINVKRGLKTRVEMGLWPSPAPTGYLKEKRIDRKCQTIIDPDRAPIIKQMYEKVAHEKWSGRKVYHWLKFDLNFKTIGNKNLSLGNVFKLLENHFYYGTFEYPAKSGNWYQGKHTPIITKDLYDQAQQQMRKQTIVSERKEFAFTKLMTCGSCGSGITAQEKYKKQQNGNVHQYVYYGCSRSRDHFCKEGYIEEKNLIMQFRSFIDIADLDETGIRKKLKEEIERYENFQSKIMGRSFTSYPVSDTNIRTYAKFVITEGLVCEKRDLLKYLKANIKILDKKVYIQ